MVTGPQEPIETLGQRLDRQARQLMSSRTPSFSWMAAALELTAHLNSLTGAVAERFERIEASGAPLEFHVQAPALAELATPDETAAQPSHALPSDVQAHLRRTTGLDASAMRVHHDAGSDRVARAYRADAVTLGRDVMFRQGRFRPRERDGFALVAHEATHVAQLQSLGALWRRLSSGGRRDEEQLAEGNERRATSSTGTHIQSTPPARRRRDQWHGWGLGSVDGITVTPTPAPPQARSAAPAPTAAPSAMQPMLAAEGRGDDNAPLALDVEALQRSLLRDLKHQLRQEFERGA